jgi:hypothetical protein
MKTTILCIVLAFTSMIWTTFIDMPNIWKAVLYFINGGNLCISGYNIAIALDIKRIDRIIWERKNGLRFFKDRV